MSERRIGLAIKRIKVRGEKIHRYMDRVMWLQNDIDKDKELIDRLETNKETGK